MDINDLTIVLAHYGQSVGSSAGPVAAVPEPGALLLTAGLASLTRPALGRSTSKDRRMLAGAIFALAMGVSLGWEIGCRRGEGSPVRCFAAPASSVGTTG